MLVARISTIFRPSSRFFALSATDTPSIVALPALTRCSHRIELGSDQNDVLEAVRPVTARDVDEQRFEGRLLEADRDHWSREMWIVVVWAVALLVLVGLLVIREG